MSSDSALQDSVFHTVFSPSPDFNPRINWRHKDAGIEHLILPDVQNQQLLYTTLFYHHPPQIIYSPFIHSADLPQTTKVPIPSLAPSHPPQTWDVLLKHCLSGCGAARNVCTSLSVPTRNQESGFKIKNAFHVSDPDYQPVEHTKKENQTHPSLLHLETKQAEKPRTVRMRPYDQLEKRNGMKRNRSETERKDARCTVANVIGRTDNGTSSVLNLECAGPKTNSAHSYKKQEISLSTTGLRNGNKWRQKRPSFFINDILGDSAKSTRAKKDSVYTHDVWKTTTDFDCTAQKSRRTNLTLVGLVRRKRHPQDTLAKEDFVTHVESEQERAIKPCVSSKLTWRMPMSLCNNSRPRKARTAFTEDQLQALEAHFDQNKYLSFKDRTCLAETLQLSDTQIKTWYQNRRTKWKRQTAAGLELLREAGNIKAVRKILTTSNYWSTYHPHVTSLVTNLQLSDTQEESTPAQHHVLRENSCNANNL